MKPSQEYLDKLKPILPEFVADQLDNILLDWEADAGIQAEEQTVSQPMIDYLFGIYIGGLLNGINPASNFNSKYRALPKLNRHDRRSAKARAK